MRSCPDAWTVEHGSSRAPEHARSHAAPDTPPPPDLDKPAPAPRRINRSRVTRWEDRFWRRLSPRASDAPGSTRGGGRRHSPLELRVHLVEERAHLVETVSRLPEEHRPELEG